MTTTAWIVPANLFSESLVAVNATTGERQWHCQMVHHGVWDYDLPPAPNPVDITVDGRPIKAVAQISKQGFVCVFDRVTGEPVWPIEERPVPQSPVVAGERLSPTQPFPTKPAPLDRQGVTVDDLTDFAPGLRAEAQAIIERHDYGPLYTPITERGTILPGPPGLPLTKPPYGRITAIDLNTGEHGWMRPWVKGRGITTPSVT